MTSGLILWILLFKSLPILGLDNLGLPETGNLNGIYFIYCIVYIAIT